MADIGQGFKYQLSVTAYLASCLSKNKTVKDYHIFHEVNKFEPFDNIVLAVNYNESDDFHLHLVQVKYGKVMLEINKYLTAYNEIMQNKKWNFLDDIRINEEHIQFWYFACKNFSTKAQNISFQEDSQTKQLILTQRKCGDYESIFDKQYSNNHKLCLKDNTITTKHQDFFNNFYIYLKQPEANKIMCILGGMWKLNSPSQVIDYLDKYFTKNKTARLSKTVFEHELLKIRLANYIVTPVKVIPFKRETADAWINLTLSHNVTIIDDAPHTKARLFGCILPNIEDVITVEEWNKCVGNEGKLSNEVRTRFSSEASKPQTLKDLSIHLWMSKKIPLVLKTDDDLLALEEFSHMKQRYVIIDSKPRKRYAEMKSYRLSVIKDLGGLQADKLLQSIFVSMQGKKPTSLYEVINDDKTLLEKLTCTDILKLMEPKQLYLTNKCFKDGSDMLFIIETANTEELNEEYYKIIDDNILMYCPSNESDIYYQAAVRNPQFKNYKIYRLYSQHSEDSEETLSLTNAHESTELEFGEEGNITESNSAEEHTGLEYFFVDQHGNSVYRANKNEGVPVIGEMINMSCPRYLARYMRKGIIKHGKNRSSSDNNRNSIIEYPELPFLEKDFFNKTTRKVCVVTGEAGIGKTTFLKSLVQACCPQNYVLFSDLALYQTDLYDKNSKKSEFCRDPLNFLRNKHNSLPCKNFLSALEKDPERLIIILDSLDEVVATCKEKVLNVIDNLNREPCLQKIIIGARLLTVTLLSNKFDVDVLEIEGLSTEWNGDYLQNWNFDENYTRNIPAEFLKNPLYLNFLKIIVASNINMESLNRWSLFKTIIDLNIELYYERRNQNPDDTERSNILKYFYALAFQALLPYNRITKKLAEDIKQKYTNFARIGIIKRFDKKEMPVFVHHTFVEFLISRWLIENSDKEDAKHVYEHILRYGMHDILDIYSEQFPLHKAIIEEDLPQVKYLCKENPVLLRESDGLGRTALHIAALEYSIFDKKENIADIILQNTLEKNLNLYPCDKLLNLSWINYCHKYLCQNVEDFCDLSDSILKAYWNYQYQIKNESSWIFMDDDAFDMFCGRAFDIPSIDIIKTLFLLKYYNNKDFMQIYELCSRTDITTTVLPKSSVPELRTTLMHLACIYSNINIVSACIDRGDDINARDSLGCTPLYYSVCSQDRNIVELLLEKGADMKLNPRDDDVVTLFKMSLRTQNKNILAILIKAMDKSFQDWQDTTPLHDAVRYNKLDVVEMLLKAGADMTVLDEYGNTFLHLAVRYKNKGLIQLLSQYQFNVNIINKKGQTPLIKALRTEDMQLIEILLQLGADVNIHDQKGNTPLGIAVKHNKYLMQLLLQYGADVNGINRIGETAVFSTVKICDTRKLEILLNAGANVDIQDVTGSTALHIAADRSNCKSVFPKGSSSEAENYMQMIEMLLYANADVNIVNECGDTPLHKAVSAGFEDAVQLFLHQSNTICVNRESRSGDTPLCSAIRKKNVEMVNILLENGADVNYVDKSGRHLSPLFNAVEIQNLEIIEKLLCQGADVNFKNEYDVTPLYVAVITRNLDIVKLLLKYNAHLNTIKSINTLLTNAKVRGDINGAVELLNYWAMSSENPLNDISFSNEVKQFILTVTNKENINLMNEIRLDRNENNLELVHALLKVAAEITNQTPIGIKCLNTVLELNNEEIDRILLGNFENKYREIIEKFTDVGYAAIEENTTMVKILLRNRQNTNTTALTRVIEYCKQIRPIEILLQNQIDVNLPDKHGEIPLLLAVNYSTPDIVEILLENGATVNISKWSSKVTPLSEAVDRNKSKIVLLLLKKGADINVGYEPLLNTAVQNENAKIVRMLLEYGADPNERDEDGQTALHHAADTNKKYLVKKLLEFNADVNIKNSDGLTPIDNAIRERNHDIINILQKGTGGVYNLGENDVSDNSEASDSDDEDSYSESDSDDEDSSSENDSNDDSDSYSDSDIDDDFLVW